MGALMWMWRYAAENRRRLAAARQRYLAEVVYCVLLGAGRWR